MLANNETGVIQPVAAAAEIVQAAGGLLHTDAVQGPGKIAVDMAALGVDLLSLSGHKFGGPQGIGALVARPGLEPAPLLRGGGQERRRRAGTENVAAIAGFGLACEIAAERREEESRNIKALRDELEAEVARISDARAVIAGAAAPRLPNTACIGLAGVPSELQVMTLDLAGVAVSAGSACSSGKVTASHVLQAMGFGEQAASAIRVSLGWASTEADVAGFVSAWAEMYRRLGKRAAAE
jgi:cysteine desulfurase